MLIHYLLILFLSSLDWSSCLTSTSRLHSGSEYISPFVQIDISIFLASISESDESVSNVFQHVTTRTVIAITNEWFALTLLVFKLSSAFACQGLPSITLTPIGLVKAQVHSIFDSPLTSEPSLSTGASLCSSLIPY